MQGSASGEAEHAPVLFMIDGWSHHSTGLPKRMTHMCERLACLQARELDAHIANHGSANLPLLAGVPIAIKVWCGVPLTANGRFGVQCAGQ